MKFLGIDGCRAGWIGVYVEDSEAGPGRTVLWRSTRDMVAAAAQANIALLDMPIGLVSPPDTVRRCETDARRLLGPRRASVFSSPARATLSADTYEEAKALNQDATGRKLTLQAWHILHRIREVDKCIGKGEIEQSIMRESHPELAFCMLNGAAAMQHNKKSAAGRAERMAVLEQLASGVQKWFDRTRLRFRARDVATDDLIDAAILGLQAREGSRGGFVSLPAPAQYDETGLRMEIVYANPREAASN